MIKPQKNNPSVLHTQNSSANARLWCPYTGEPSFWKKTTYVFLDIVCYYAHGGSSEPPLFLCIIKTVIFPFCRICIYVFPYPLIIFFIADNVVVIRALPNGIAYLFCHHRFEGTNNIIEVFCRGGCPHPPVKKYNHMYMIWHNYVFVNCYIFIFYIYVIDVFITHISDFG